jgi:hypothetical protein
MTRADRVHSTPRKTAFKTKSKEKEKPVAAEARNHREMFRNLEAPMRELFCMAEITAEVATGLQTDERIEITHFAIYRLCEMVRDLRAQYMTDLRLGAEVT